MQTSFPNLPFSFTNVHAPPTFRSAAGNTPRSSPKTDLRTLSPWSSFQDDIDRAIQTAMTRNKIAAGTQYTVGGYLARPRTVRSKAGLRGHAGHELHSAVIDVLEILGVKGEFYVPGGGLAMVGDPDLSWMQDSAGMQPDAKLIVGFKTWREADLMDLPNSFAKPARTANESQSVDALEQIYGYMSFNENRFGILTNWARAWSFRRDSQMTLQYAGPIELCNRASISMLKLCVGMVLLAQDDWFRALPSPDVHPHERFYYGMKTALAAPKKAIMDTVQIAIALFQGTYPCLTLDFRLCKFDLNTARCSEQGCVVRASLRRQGFQDDSLQVICKIVDITRSEHGCNELQEEVRMYAALRHLQGKVLPRLHGYYEVWGILRLMALEPVGSPIPNVGPLAPALVGKMKDALQSIHSAGYVHGDIARGNFCERDGEVFVVDLELCRKAKNNAEKSAEMEAIDLL